MSDFLNFIREHSHAIIELVLLICVLFVTLFRKKVKVHDTFEIVLLTLPDFINEAESLNLSGSDKFAFVFNKCVGLIQDLTHKKGSEVLDEYSSLINEAIENILTTPQKKER